jgi:hypothetical protein
VENDDAPGLAKKPLVVIVVTIVGFLFACPMAMMLAMTLAIMIIDIAGLWCDVPFISRWIPECP